MSIFFLVLTIIIFVLLLFLGAVRPVHSEYSLFELERRAGLGDREAKRALAREKLLGAINSLQRAKIALLQVALVALSELTFGWELGILAAVVMSIFYVAVTRTIFLSNLSQKIYSHIEKPMLDFIKKHPRFFWIFQGSKVEDSLQTSRLGSREELQQLIKDSTDALTPDEKSLIISGLSFSDQLVDTIMTPREAIDSIKRTEFLGPLTLDELHKTGHSKLPVTAGDLDHIIGILHLEGLLALDIKRSVTAEKAMDPKVFYINQNQTLRQALMEFVSTRYYILIVVDEDRKTVGILTLNDVIEALVGHKIVDEFDLHDNLKAVASRK